MGDCGNPKCLQERRYFKKELLSWYKKVPYARGLELIADYLSEGSNGHLKTLMLPFNDMEPEEPTDFADSDAVCCFCDGVKEECASPKEEAPSEPVPALMLQEAERNSAEVSPESAAGMHGLSSYYNQLIMTSLLYQQQLQSVSAVSSAVGLPQAAAADNPLDLSPHCSSGALYEHKELRIPEPKLKRRKDPLPKRSYTDRELSAAVEAIQSGAIGTRRAAQMYGVPRSTLRNKVFKAAEMHRTTSDTEQNGHHSSHSNDGMSEHVDSAAEKPASVSPVLVKEEPASTSFQGGSAGINGSPYHATFQKQLQELQNKSALVPPASMNPFGDIFNPLQFSYPFGMHHHQYPAMSTMPGMDFMNPYAASLMMPYLPDIVKSLTQRRLDQSMDLASMKKVQSGAASSISSSHAEKEIKVPAYKPTSNSTNHHSSGSSAPLSQSKMSAVDNPFLNLASLRSPAHKSEPVRPKKHKQEPPRESDTHGNGFISSPNGLVGKKRPKRGQYRKYDSELLAQAVRAVQRGEMSVHRAGTYFGVPHSTLEYKVKERHLLRKKKIAEGAEAGKSNGEKSPMFGGAACGNSSDSSQSEKTLSSQTDDSAPLPFAGLHRQPEGVNFSKSSPHEVPSMPAFPGIDTSATELLKKLHAHAQEKANKLMVESPIVSADTS